jgi:hypothetical protein
MADSKTHRWQFATRFRRNAFGWRSQPAIERVREAVAEIKKAARRDPVLAADGAVLFLEKVSPALEQVDSSSGAIGTTVNYAIEELVSIIARHRWTLAGARNGSSACGMRIWQTRFLTSRRWVDFGASCV